MTTTRALASSLIPVTISGSSRQNAARHGVELVRPGQADVRDLVADVDVEAGVGHAPEPYGGARYGRGVPPVLEMSGVSVVREGATLLADVDWTVARGRALGGARAERRRQDHAAAGRRRRRCCPSAGRVDLLGERFGAADLGELRTRVGLSSAALADRVPAHEPVLDVVVTAAYGVVGRWGGGHDEGDVGPRDRPARAGRAAAVRRTGGSARCPRASASGCCWPARS